MALKVINPNSGSEQTDKGVCSFMPKLDEIYKKTMIDNVEVVSLDTLLKKVKFLEKDLLNICNLVDKNGSICLKNLSKELKKKWELK